MIGFRSLETDGDFAWHVKKLPSECEKAWTSSSSTSKLENGQSENARRVLPTANTGGFAHSLPGPRVEPKAWLGKGKNTHWALWAWQTQVKNKPNVPETFRRFHDDFREEQESKQAG